MMDGHPLLAHPPAPGEGVPSDGGTHPIEKGRPHPPLGLGCRSTNQKPALNREGNGGVMRTVDEHHLLERLLVLEKHG